YGPRSSRSGCRRDRSKRPACSRRRGSCPAAGQAAADVGDDGVVAGLRARLCRAMGGDGSLVIVALTARVPSARRGGGSGPAADQRTSVLASRPRARGLLQWRGAGREGPARQPRNNRLAMADTPNRSASDRNLLFGILALQMDFIGGDQLIAGMNAWVLDKGKPLGDILLGQGVLAEDERAVLDALVEKHLRKHGGDPQRSLASLASGGTPNSVHAELQGLADPDLDASLAHVAATPTPSAPDLAGP